MTGGKRKVTLSLSQPIEKGITLLQCQFANRVGADEPESDVVGSMEGWGNKTDIRWRISEEEVHTCNGVFFSFGRTSRLLLKRGAGCVQLVRYTSLMLVQRVKVQVDALFTLILSPFLPDQAIVQKTHKFRWEVDHQKARSDHRTIVVHVAEMKRRNTKVDRLLSASSLVDPMHSFYIHAV